MPSPQSDLIAPDLILLLLVAPGVSRYEEHQLNGITRLEKLLFLADKETSVASDTIDAFAFRPYHYGPYSKQVYEAIDLLEEAHLIREERLLEGQTLDEVEELDALAEDREGIERRFRLTREGVAVAELLAQRNPATYQSLARIRQKYGAIPLRQLIRYVYSRYPEYAKESRIADEVM